MYATHRRETYVRCMYNVIVCICHNRHLNRNGICFDLQAWQCWGISAEIQVRWLFSLPVDVRCQQWNNSIVDPLVIISNQDPDLQQGSNSVPEVEKVLSREDWEMPGPRWNQSKGKHTPVFTKVCPFYPLMMIAALLTLPKEQATSQCVHCVYWFSILPNSEVRVTGRVKRNKQQILW